MQRDRDDVLVADAACKLIRDEDDPLSPARMSTSAQESERTHKFALRIKIHRSDFLSLCHVRIWANGIPAYAFWRDAKVMCDGGHVNDAHNTRGRVLGGCNQNREQQFRQVKGTYGVQFGSFTIVVCTERATPRTKNVCSELPIISLFCQRLHWWEYESAVKRACESLTSIET